MTDFGFWIFDFGLEEPIRIESSRSEIQNGEIWLA